MEEEYIDRYHKHVVKDHQCSSLIVKHIKAPLHLVWSLVRSFDQPQKYKPFISRCKMYGDVRVGSIRKVNIKTGLPATTSWERLECLDDKEHILSMKIIGGDHRLKNYSSVITLHRDDIDGISETLMIESFVVDVPNGNTKEETCYFIKTLINFNINSLTSVCRNLLKED